MKRGICLFLFYLVLSLSLNSSVVFSQVNPKNPETILNTCTVEAKSNLDKIKVTLRATQSGDIFIYRYDENVISEIGNLELITITQTSENNIYNFNYQNKEYITDQKILNEICYIDEKEAKIEEANLENPQSDRINLQEEVQPTKDNTEKGIESGSSVKITATLGNFFNFWIINPIMNLIQTIKNLINGSLNNFFNPILETYLDFRFPLLGGQPTNTEPEDHYCDVYPHAHIFGAVNVYCRERPEPELNPYIVLPRCVPCTSTVPQTGIPPRQPITPSGDQLDDERLLQVVCYENDIPVAGGGVVSQNDCNSLEGTIDDYGHCNVGPQYTSEQLGVRVCNMPAAKISSAKEEMNRGEGATSQPGCIEIIETRIQSEENRIKIVGLESLDTPSIKAIIEEIIKREKSDNQCTTRPASQPTECKDLVVLPLDVFLNKKDCKLYYDNACKSEVKSEEVIQKWIDFIQGGSPKVIIGLTSQISNPIDIIGSDGQIMGKLILLDAWCKQIDPSTMNELQHYNNIVDGTYLKNLINCCDNTQQLPKYPDKYPNPPVGWDKIKNSRSEWCQPNNKVYIGANLDESENNDCRSVFKGHNSENLDWATRGFARTRIEAERVIRCLSTISGKNFIQNFRNNIVNDLGLTINKDGTIKIVNGALGIGANWCTLVNLGNLYRWTIIKCKEDPSQCYS